ncbi:MAG: leucyl aminopeptidase [Parachlamydiales bacterium]|nr:leucyl aminopeptidase [Parachlamydiales bacterium]
MHITSNKVFKEESSSDCVIVSFFEGKKGAEKACSYVPYRPLFSQSLYLNDFHGKKDEILFFYHPKKRVLLLGLGKKEEVDSDTIRKSFAQAVSSLHAKKAKVVELIFPDLILLERGDIARAVAEGVFLSNYAFDDFKSEKTTVLEQLRIYGVTRSELETMKKAKVLAASVNVARDLINNNADMTTPQQMANVAQSLEQISSKISVTVLDKKMMEKEKMGLLLAVGKGASCEPRFVVIQYKGNDKSKDHTVLVGKGITYDTGGLCLKPPTGMDTMKSDMSGAAAVIGTMHALATLGLSVNVTGIFPATENAIGPNSYKTGDVFVSMSGKTVEVVNTDAEGRLILADALHYAVKKLKPSRILDIASLTGAIAIALGEDVTGLFSNNDDLVEQLMIASFVTGEKLWRMPLVKDYKHALKSSIADIKNCGDRKGSSITAALFLEDFVQSVPWAHLDIGGTCFHEKPKGVDPTSATGVGVRLLVELIETIHA